MSSLHALANRIQQSLQRASIRLLHHDRGDVPGWVLITMMTAGLVVVLWALAGPALSNVFNQAIQRVTSF